MTVAQGINKLTVWKAQTGLGVAASGAGGQVLRRKTSVSGVKRATYTNDEIVQHQQSTGVNLGAASSSWTFDGLLSPGTYSGLLAGLIRKAFVATTPIANASITIASLGNGVYTVSRAAGSFLTDGVKVGDVVRLTAGTFNAANLNNNLLVGIMTATVLTVTTVNGNPLVAEGPIASAGVTVFGKKCIVPMSGHTDTLFTIEEWYADISKSEVFPDLRIGQADIGLPASGNATIKLMAQGLGARVGGSAQVLTSPLPATTSPVLTAVRGLLRINNTSMLTVTGVTLSIKTTLTAEGPVVGSNYAPDMARGRIEVSGQFTALFENTTLRDIFDNETLTSLSVVMGADTTNNADFIAMTLSAIKLTDSDADDGEKAVLRTYPFTAQLNAAGGPALANDMTIFSIQDSLA